MSDNQEQDNPSWITAPGGVVDVYANNFHITWTKDDVRIRLAVVVPNPDSPDPGAGFRGVNEEKAAITVAWRMAKVLLTHLSKAVDSYEKVNGEIKMDLVLPPP
jgi:hypothetical protein